MGIFYIITYKELANKTGLVPKLVFYRRAQNPPKFSLIENISETNEGKFAKAENNNNKFDVVWTSPFLFSHI